MKNIDYRPEVKKSSDLRLQYQLSCLRVTGDIGSESHGTRPLARGVLPSRHQIMDILYVNIAMRRERD